VQFGSGSPLFTFDVHKKRREESGEPVWRMLDLLPIMLHTPVSVSMSPMVQKPFDPVAITALLTQIPPPTLPADPASPYARSSSSHTTAATAADNDQGENLRDQCTECEAKRLGKQMARVLLEARDKLKADELAAEDEFKDDAGEEDMKNVMS